VNTAPVPLPLRQHHAKTFHQLALPEVRFKNLVNVLRAGRPIPDPLGIHDQQRTGLAKAETTRRRKTNLRQPFSLEFLRQPVP